MQGKKSIQKPPAFLDGTPGVFVRRQSPPKIPANVPPPTVLLRKSAPPRSRFGSQTSCASTSGGVEAAPVPAPTTPTGSQPFDLPLQQQRTSAARKPVARTHPNTSRELSSHSFSDASKRNELVTLRKSLTSSQSIGNVVGQNDYLASKPMAHSTHNMLDVHQQHDAPTLWNMSASLHSLPGGRVVPGSSILLDNHPHQQDPESELPLPTNWAIELTPDGYRYYVDHNNRRTHWIHPLATENLPPGWTKIFDESLGVVYYNEVEHKSQFEHPGLATAASKIAQVHGSVTSIAPYRSQFNEEDVEDLNIISEEIPVWLQMYSEAPSETDHLLNFKLFKLRQLEAFDEMLLKLFKQDAINTVIKYEKPRREINRELLRRLV